MFDDNILKKAKAETYQLKIIESFGNKKVKAISTLILNIVKTIQDIYYYIEPSHFKGKLVICSNLNDNLVLATKSQTLYDKNILTTKRNETILFQLMKNEELKMWEGINFKAVLKTKEALFYCYSDFEEYFVINGQKINLIKEKSCASTFSTDYFNLDVALRNYQLDKILYSSCGHFQRCWYDAKTRLFFKATPENDMQESLESHLISALSLRGIDIEREHQFNARNPVDIFISWKNSNRKAVIELKWMGKSKGNNGKIHSFSDFRANDGAKQVKEYLDMAARDMPQSIIKGYLIIIDGRRRNPQNKYSISERDGFFYENKEIKFKPENDYFGKVYNFEKPIKMFTRPVCN